MRKKKLVKFAVIAIVSVAFILTFGKTYSRYILTRQLELDFKSIPFYFEATTNISEVKMLQGNFDIKLNVKNYTDEGINSEDISYTYYIKETDKFRLSNSKEQKANTTRTLKGEENSMDTISLRVIIVPNAILENIENLTIVVTSFEPYSKTIEIPIKVSLPAIASGYANDYRTVEFSDNTDTTKTEEDFKNLYCDNNCELEYAEDGSIVLDEDNAIPTFDRTDRNYENGYSVYITIKGDIYQWPSPPKYDIYGNASYDAWGPATIFAMSDIDKAESNRLCWFGFRNGYFQIYSYSNITHNNVDGPMADGDGFVSVAIPAKYNNQILNIQITGIHGGITNVYFNGELFTSFESGPGNGSFNTAIIGDLRAARGLKFKGNFYDIAVYDRVLSSAEIQQNWSHAQYTWNINY